MTPKPRWLAGLDSAEAVYVVDSDRRILLWNKAAEQLFGYGEQEILGRRCCDTIAGRSCDGTAWCHSYCQVQRAVSRGGTHRSFDLVAQAKNGSELHVNVSIIIIPFRGKRLTAHVARSADCQDRDKGTLLKIREALQDGGALDRAAANAGSGKRVEPGLPAALPSLTGREIEILSLVAEGSSNAAIAKRLCVSLYTVRNHMQHILDKLGLHSKAQAVTFAFKNHLLN